MTVTDVGQRNGWKLKVNAAGTETRGGEGRGVSALRLGHRSPPVLRRKPRAEGDGSVSPARGRRSAGTARPAEARPGIMSAMATG